MHPFLVWLLCTAHEPGTYDDILSVVVRENRAFQDIPPTAVAGAFMAEAGRWAEQFGYDSDVYQGVAEAWVSYQQWEVKTQQRRCGW